jgi:hypothetical protein
VAALARCNGKRDRALTGFGAQGRRAPKDVGPLDIKHFEQSIALFAATLITPHARFDQEAQALRAQAPDS